MSLKKERKKKIAAVLTAVTFTISAVIWLHMRLEWLSDFTGLPIGPDFGDDWRAFAFSIMSLSGIIGIEMIERG